MTDLINELIKIEDAGEEILNKARDTQADLEVIKNLIYEKFNKKLEQIINAELDIFEKQNSISLEKKLNEIKIKYDNFLEYITNELDNKKDDLVDKIFHDLLDSLSVDLNLLEDNL